VTRPTLKGLDKMRILAKVFIYLMMAIAGLAILGAFTGDVFDGYAFWGGIAYGAQSIIAVRFISITEKYEKVAKEMAEEDRINKLVDQKLQERN
jgi:hypothetical protein